MSDNNTTKNNKRKRQLPVSTSAKSPVLSSTPPSNATATVAAAVSVEAPPGPLPSQPNHLHLRSKGFVTPDQRLPASPPLPTAAPTIMSVVRHRCNAALNMLFCTQPIVLNQPCNLPHRQWRQQQQQQQQQQQLQQQQSSLRPNDNSTTTPTSKIDSSTSRTGKLQQVQPQWRRRRPSPTHQQQQQDHQHQQQQQQQQQHHHEHAHDHQPDATRKASSSSAPHTLPSIPQHSTTSSLGSVSPLPSDHAAASITRVSKRRRIAAHTDQVVPDSAHLTSSPYPPTSMPHSSLPSPNAGAGATSDMSHSDNNHDSHNHASPRLSLSPNAHHPLSRPNSQSSLSASPSSSSPSPPPQSPTTPSQQPSTLPSVPYVPRTPSPTSGTTTIDHLHQQQQLEPLSLSSRQRPTSQQHQQQQLTQSSDDKILQDAAVVLASTAAEAATVPTTPKPAMTSTPLNPLSPLSLLCDEEHCVCANSMWTSAGIGPEVMLRTAEELSDTIMRMYGRGIDMSTNDIDYARLSKSVAFRRYLTCARKLRYFDPLLLNDKERKAFFLNVYNSLMIHAITTISKPRTMFDRVSLYNSAAYNIGGRSYTLNMIEHGVLRANKCGSGPFAQTPFALADARRLCSLPDVDPRIHFALNCGARSCPPVRFYEAHSLDAALDAATRAYLLDIEVDTNLRKITLPKLLQWYKMDFCHNGDVDLVLEWTLPYLTDDKKKDMEQFLREKQQNGLQFKVAYRAYDWTVNDISNST